MKGSSAFSLIEVTLALAIVAIGLIAIVGMLPHGIQASRDAADNTLAATIAHDELNKMRLATTMAGGPPAPVDIYYDASGTNSFPAGSTSPDRYFHITATPQLSATVPNLYMVNAIVSWPAKSQAPPNTNFFATQIAVYQ
jgi:uncharacterized protein (TIGR02598 family)